MAYLDFANHTNAAAAAAAAASPSYSQKKRQLSKCSVFVTRYSCVLICFNLMSELIF